MVTVGFEQAKRRRAPVGNPYNIGADESDVTDTEQT